MKYFAVWLAMIFAFCAELNAQNASTPATRAEQIESEQAAKAQSVSPDLPDSVEQRFEHIENDARHVLQGSRARLQVGGLPMPSGFAVGPAVGWQNSQDTVRVNSWAVGSIKQFYSVGTGLEFPRVTSQRLDVTLRAAHLDLPQLDFYGEGPKSLKSNRTDYRREDTWLDGGVDWRALRHVNAHCKAGQLWLNVGPGTSDSITSTNLKFGPAEAPGIDVQTNYFVAGCGVEFDFRDRPEFPRKGTALFLDYRRYLAETLSINSFHQVTGSFEQYVPFFNEKRVIALHAAANMTFNNSNQVVPFYMQPTLGGFNDLRGYRPLRFYDDNAVVASAEYRWEVSTGLDLAVFGDAGEVFHRPSQFSLSRIQNDVGFGLRFNNQRNLVFRIDTGFSREGFQVWVAFNKLF
jgi:hypothetical protein